MAAEKKVQVQVRSYSYRVVIEEDAFPDGTRAFHAYVPSLKGCRSWGYTIEEALKNVQEAAEVWIEDALKHGEALPQESIKNLLSIRWKPVNDFSAFIEEL